MSKIKKKQIHVYPDDWAELGAIAAELESETKTQCSRADALKRVLEERKITQTNMPIKEIK